VLLGCSLLKLLLLDGSPTTVKAKVLTKFLIQNAEEAAEIKKRRTFRKFSYRGVDLDKYVIFSFICPGDPSSSITSHATFYSHSRMSRPRRGTPIGERKYSLRE
jgi:hypothetical protein